MIKFPSLLSKFPILNALRTKISNLISRYGTKDTKSTVPTSYTSKTGKSIPEKTTSSTLNKKGSKTKDLDTKLDEEYAKSYQT